MPGNGDSRIANGLAENAAMNRLPRIRRERTNRWLGAAGAAAGAVLATLLIYHATLRRDFGFVYYDDPVYVLDNPAVANGLTRAGLVWAFTESWASNWHPLTWISLMIDAHWGGLDPRVFHGTNLILHALTGGILWAALARMTGRPLVAALAVLLWLIHPVHVESVAWISERKGSLAAFFFAVTLWFYTRYADRPRLSWYLATWMALAWGLLAKQTLVAAPILLFVLDFWPLRRAAGFGTRLDAHNHHVGATARPQYALRWLVVEKLPLLTLSLGFSGATYWAQRAGGAVSDLSSLPLASRFKNALVSSVGYLADLAIPRNLSPMYPHPGDFIPWSRVAISAALLLGITIWLVARSPRRPHGLVGWLWFFGMLTPVMGLVQVGSCARADRYLLIPALGLYWAGAWTVGDGFRRWPLGRPLLVLVVGSWLLYLGIGAHQQVNYWHDSERLFRRAIEVDPVNWLAHNNLGLWLAKNGDPQRGLQHLRQAVRLNPGMVQAVINLGNLLTDQGDARGAIEILEIAARQTRSVDLLNTLGKAYHRGGDAGKARAVLEEARRLDPDSALVLGNLGAVLASQKEWGAAKELLQASLALDPDNADVHFNLAMLALLNQNWPEATRALEQADRLWPGSAQILSGWEQLDARMGQPARTTQRYRQAVNRFPDRVELGCRLAWILATHPDADRRSGAEACALAEVLRARQPRSPVVLDVLAASYAEHNRFAEANATAHLASQAAEQAGLLRFLSAIQGRAKLYQAGQPFRDPSLRHPLPNR